MEDPFSGSHFQIEWGGDRIGFKEISGLEVKTEVIEYREGSSPEYTSKKMPGLLKYGNIRLSRGVLKNDNNFFEWFKTIQLNQVERRDIVISLLNEEHEPVVVWKLKNAFPVSIKWDKLDAAENKVFLEHLEIATDGITVEIP